ncbi:glycosyltransferase [Rhodococcus kroppenstedtii]|uniref:glycosyltransferase family 2 protein n=1 Tax=Rhodococcoides kroppenstedtii TaxID=293050 RepID=UPI001C9B98E2|nr:glycosyltransferase [Rhodococcus kroppenstedtii]MBY6437541.1 glycosyltransferase [Rhodococcus kroppenstedtii]
MITAAYNAAATIEDCIASVQCQTITNWEMIIVDDASTDETAEIVANYAYTDSRIRLLRQAENAGSGFCRNLAITHARADLVAILDSDDVSESRRLEIQIEFMNKNPAVTAVASQLKQFGTWGGPEISSWPTDTQEIRNRQDRNRMPLPHPSVMIRLEDAKRAGGYDPFCRRSQDFAMFLKLKDKQLACLDEALVAYRTDRPVKLTYALRSGRYGALARARSLRGSTRTEPRRLPASLITDVLSLLGWLKRRSREHPNRQAKSAPGSPDNALVQTTRGASK